MLEEAASHPAALARREHVCMTDQIDVTHLLNAHHSYQFSVCLIAPEYDAARDLALELFQGHIWLVPAVVRDHPAICLRRGVHDREHRRDLVASAEADRAQPRISALGAVRTKRPPNPAIVQLSPGFAM